MNTLQLNLWLVSESLRIGDKKEALAILESLIDSCPNKICQTLNYARSLMRGKKIQDASEQILKAIDMLNPTAREGVKTEILAVAGIHGIARITDDGDNSEPATLCDTSMIRITDDAGKEFVALACELDAIAAAWRKIRKAK